MTINQQNDAERYTFKCNDARSIESDYPDLKYLNNTVPAILALTKEVPWFKESMNVGDRWHFEYKSDVPSRGHWNTVDWVADFEVLSKKTVWLKLKLSGKILPGAWRAGKHIRIQFPKAPIAS